MSAKQKLEFGGTNADLSAATPLDFIRVNAGGTALEAAAIGSTVQLFSITGTFNGINTTFTNALPATPSVVFLFQTRLGKLWRTSSGPGIGEFVVSGGTLRDIEFGDAPISGDQIDGILIPA